MTCISSLLGAETLQNYNAKTIREVELFRRRSKWVSLVHEKLEVCLRLSSSDWLLIDKHISDRQIDGAKVPQQWSLPKGSLFNGKYMEVELYPGTTIAFSREIEKTDAKNVRGLRGEKALAPFLISRAFYFPLHWPRFRDVLTSWRAWHRRKQRRLSVIAYFRTAGFHPTLYHCELFAQFPFNSGSSI